MISKWSIVPLLCLLLFGSATAGKDNDQVCTLLEQPYDFFRYFHRCLSHLDPFKEPPPDRRPIMYILYDVNPSEGFNLRRDVYIRLAVFLRSLVKRQGYENTKLVLPPWSELYHWRSNTLSQMYIPWSHFFDLESMRQFADVIEMEQFFREYDEHTSMGGKCTPSKMISINEFYRLLHFDDMFENGVFVDKFEQAACKQKSILPVGGINGIMGYVNMSIDELICVKFQGSASLVFNMFEKFKARKPQIHRTVFLYSAEIVLHDYWGNVDYWQARRSMRFSKALVQVADQFRLDYFNSTNERDRVQRPASWSDEKPYRKAKGGDYLCAHIRRADFLYGREKTTPSLHSAAAQIKRKLLELGLRKVFIASDCPKTEFHDLKNYLKRFKVVRFTPESKQELDRLKDGGVAIIDQIVCSHARYFIGTYESTFTYRIYEEREILGFPRDLTFNTFCKSEEASNCEKNAVWPIQYD